MKKVLKELLGVICGAVSGFLAYLIVYYLVYFIGKVPLLNLIVYYPAGSSWALAVLPSTTSVLIGGTVATVVAGRPKWYSILTIVVNVLPIAYALLTSQLGLGLLIGRGLFIIPAAVLLVSDADESVSESRSRKLGNLQVETETTPEKELSSPSPSSQMSAASGAVVTKQVAPSQTESLEEWYRQRQIREVEKSEQEALAMVTNRHIASLRESHEYEKADEVLALAQKYLSQLMSLEQWAIEYRISEVQFNACVEQWRDEFDLKLQEIVPQS